MTPAAGNDKKYVKFDSKYLYLKVDGQVRLLGPITTRKGALTREQKLRAVARAGEWVEL